MEDEGNELFNEQINGLAKDATDHMIADAINTIKGGQRVHFSPPDQDQDHEMASPPPEITDDQDEIMQDVDEVAPQEDPEVVTGAEAKESSGSPAPPAADSPPPQQRSQSPQEPPEKHTKIEEKEATPPPTHEKYESPPPAIPPTPMVTNENMSPRAPKQTEDAKQASHSPSPNKESSPVQDEVKEVSPAHSPSPAKESSPQPPPSREEADNQENVEPPVEERDPDHEEKSQTPPKKGVRFQEPLVVGPTPQSVLATMDVVQQHEIDVEAGVLRQQAEDNIQFMNKIFQSITALTVEIKNLEARLAEAEANLKRVREEKAEVEEDLSKQFEYSHSLEEEIKKLRAQIAALQEELSITQGDLREQIDSQQSEIANLKNEVRKQSAKVEGLRWLKTQVDAFHLGKSGLFDEPCHACMLPDNFVIVADVTQGLMLFNDDTQLIKHEKPNEEWKWPQGLAYDISNGRLFVSMVKREGTEEGGYRWNRTIGVFTLNLEFVEGIEGPRSTGFENACRENIAYSTKTKELYIGIMDNAGSGIWRRSLKEGAEDKWEEITKRTGVHFVDLQVFPSPGPLTDLLVVESKMGYVHRFTLKGSDIMNRVSQAPVPKPGSLGVDEDGNTFVYDADTGKILQLDRIDFSIKRDICLVDDAVYSITACNNYLAVAVRAGKQVHIYRYEADPPKHHEGEPKSQSSIVEE